VSADEVAARAFMADRAAGTTSAQPARTVAQSDPQSAVAEDRLARAADGIGVLLRAGSGQTAGHVADLRLLAPLDTFVSATDRLSQATAGPGGSDSGARDRIDGASSRAKRAALALETGVLNTLDTQLTAKAAEHTRHYRILLLVGAVVPLALGALLWLRVPAPAAPGAGAPGDKTVDRGHPADAAKVGPDRPERTPDFSDA
jgi:hypothetical protein